MALGSGSAVVLDIGSDSCKVGFAGDHEPKAVISTVVGRQAQQQVSVGGASKNYFGQDALNSESTHALSYPVQRGVVTDWDSMEILLDHIFQSKLSIKSQERPVLVTETPKNPTENKEKLAEVLFEKFQVPGFFSSCQAVLCLYCAGRTTGLVLDIGSGVTTAVPVYEGYSLPEAVLRMNVAGQDITEYLTKILSDRGHHFNTALDKIHVRNIKEKLCYVSLDGTKETQQPPAQTTTSASNYQLPDGKVISLADERFQCTEMLFQPDKFGFSEKTGVHQMINSAISACELDTRKSLYNNVILSGGSTQFEGLVNRLKQELKPFGALGAEARISAPKDRILSAWSGGSVLASLSSFESNWISKKEYEDSGRQVVHTRCF
ncbi:unnamed protein product [Candidula unifasciata]|uniref:Actin, cytoplasmic n=1 Tax=Candidula unifasciata TaxID=100452 RepID=A0A8S3ZU03_9EUPU|nr:unnamed protein product [Candidula unifasciata]